MARARGVGPWRLLLLLALAAPAVLAGPASPGAAAPPGPPPGRVLLLDPSRQVVGAGAAQPFAVYREVSGKKIDVTESAVLSIAPDGSCLGAVCTPRDPGDHTVWASLRSDPDVVGSAFLDVVGVDRVELQPGNSEVAAGKGQQYIARGFHLTGEPGYSTGKDVGDITAGTELSIDSPGSCDRDEHVCRSTRPGSYKVRGRLTGGDAEDGTADLTVVPGRLDRIELIPRTSTITAGATQPYRAHGFDEFDNPLGGVSDRTILEIDRGGRCDARGCTAEKAGTYTVTGTGVGVTRPGKAVLTVVAGDPAALALEPTGARIVVGAEQTFTVTAEDGHGNPAGDLTDRAVFGIRRPGRCDGPTCGAPEPGVYQVTATVARPDRPDLVGRARLTVVPGPVARIRLSPADSRIVAGARREYKAHGFDARGTPLGELTGRTTFSIESPGRCAGARCGADRTGTYTVTGTVVTGDRGVRVTATARLLVRPGVVTRLVLDPRGATVAAGVVEEFSVRGLDALGNEVGDLTADSVFRIRPGGSCAGARCSADEPGTYTVTATRIGTTVRGTAELHVQAGRLAHLVLEPTVAEAVVGAGVQYRVRGFDAFGNPRGDVTGRTLLRIAPDGSCSGATCTAAQVGEHTVSGEVVGVRERPTAAVTVRAGPPASLRLDPPASTIAAGATQPYRVEGLDRLGNSVGDLTGSVELWIGSGGSCGRTACGARRPGDYEVSATLAGSVGVGGEARLHVQAGTPKTLELQPAVVTVAAGTGQAFRARGYDALGNDLGDVTGQTRFSVADGSCDGPSCSASTPGSHTVTGRTVVGSAEGTAELRVPPPPPPPPPPAAPPPTSSPPPATSPPTTQAAVARLAPEPAVGRIAARSWLAYRVRAYDAAGRDLGDLALEAEITVQPEGRCSRGRCTASMAGAHQVLVTARGVRAEARLDVTAAAGVAQVLLDPQVVSVRTGAARAFRAWGLDSDGNEVGEVTDRTTFSVRTVGPCAGASCTVERPGTFTVTGAVGGTAVVGTARLEVVPDPVAMLELDPAAGSVWAGAWQAFHARGYDTVGNDLGDLTATTRFTIGPGGRCGAAGCTADRAGSYTVTGTVPAGAAGTAVVASASLLVVPLRPPGLPVPPWLIGVAAGVLAVSSGAVLAWFGPQIDGDGRPDKPRKPRWPDVTVRPGAGSTSLDLRQRRWSRAGPGIRVEPHGDPEGIQTVREGPP